MGRDLTDLDEVGRVAETLETPSGEEKGKGANHSVQTFCHGMCDTKASGTHGKR